MDNIENVAQMAAHNLILGVDAMDREHLALIQAFATLRLSLSQEHTDNQVAPLLLDIRQKAAQHFQTEEGLMRAHNYPVLEKHQYSHRQFTREIIALEGALAKEQEFPRRAALADHFLSNWLSHHIAEHDRELSRFLLKQPAVRQNPMQRWLHGWFHELMARILGDSSTGLRGLLFPWHHDNLLKTHRAKLLISRVRFLAFLFAVLTPAWILFDYWFFPSDLALALASARLAASGGFAFLALFFRKSDRMAHAYLASGFLFLVPLLFFLFTHILFSSYPAPQNGLSVSLITGYAFLPFVMAAGLSIFPLTALEGALFAVPGLIAQIMVMQGGSSFGGRSDALGMLWLLLLVAGIAILSGMSQLHFWSEIVNKTSKDPLTGAYNRATGQELMEKYFYLAKRARSPMWVLFFDLDNFKSINDKFGHEAGDETLKTLVSSITRSTRNADLLVRWGGEEFLAVIPLSKVENIHNIIRRICRAGSLGQRPDGAPITASVGMAEILTDNTSQLSQLIVLADQRMYRAKKSGKNRVCFGDGEGDITEVGIFG